MTKRSRQTPRNMMISAPCTTVCEVCQSIASSDATELSRVCVCDARSRGDFVRKWLQEVRRYAPQYGVRHQNHWLGLRLAMGRGRRRMSTGQNKAWHGLRSIESTNLAQSCHPGGTCLLQYSKKAWVEIPRRPHRPLDIPPSTPEVGKAVL